MDSPACVICSVHRVVGRYRSASLFRVLCNACFVLGGRTLKCRMIQASSLVVNSLCVLGAEGAAGRGVPCGLVPPPPTFRFDLR